MFLRVEAHCVAWGQMLSFVFGDSMEIAGNAPGEEGVVQETNSSEDRLRRKTTSEKEAPENELPMKENACSSSEGAPVSASDAPGEEHRVAPNDESSKRDSCRRELSSVNGLALGLCIGVAFGIIFDSLAIGIGLGLALGAAFDVFKGKIKQ